MKKVHIIKFGYRSYAADSITAATQAVALLSKLKPVKHVTEGEYDEWHYAPEDEQARPREVSLELNQPYMEPRGKKEPKPLALPKPKKGTILCICEKSYVAPRETCAHCGRDFSKSHNRTHGDDKQPKLRLI